MKIGHRNIGPDEKPFVIAEIAQTHDGSLGQALAFIDVAADCGVDAVKFQTHIAAAESTPDEPWRVAFSPQDARRYDYWQRMEFTPRQWQLLKQRADDRGIAFLSSPFSRQACMLLSELDVPAWKIASGEVHNPDVLDYACASGKPVLISSGLSTLEETIALTQRLSAAGVDVLTFHCTTQYPTPPEAVGLNVLETMLEVLETPVGLSDHSGSTEAAIIACYLGACAIEVHLTLHPRMFGPDVPSSLTPDALTALVAGVERAARMRGHPVDKSAQITALRRERTIFGRSLVAACAIRKGEAFSEDNIAFKKPGGGLDYTDRQALIGRLAARDIAQDQPLRHDDAV